MRRGFVRHISQKLALFPTFGIFYVMPDMQGPNLSLLRHYVTLDNIALELDDTFLNQLGAQVTKTAHIDKESRNDRMDLYDRAKSMLESKIKTKSWPWDKASNVIIPILKTAIIQFNAQTNPEIIKGEDVVKIAIMKTKPTKADEERAERLANHMSYQLIGVSDKWRIGTDKLLSNLALAGVTFRKTFYDPIDDCPKSVFCDVESIYVNQDVQCLSDAQRITHRFYLSMNQIMERIYAGIYTKYNKEDLIKLDDAQEIDMEKPQEIYEQHTYLDLDEDGYKEPYAITIHASTSKVLRVVARFDEECIIFKRKKFVKIKQIPCFTDFHYIPNPDGTFWSWGLADLLYSLNKAGNSMLNNLIDAATLQNLGGGFISMNARVRKREIKRRMGEYVQINVPSGTTLAQNIYDVPAAQPSPVLFQLLGFINEKSQDVSNVNNLTLGQLPGPNVQPTTIMTLLEQGGKVYSSILTRLYYAFQKEYKKIYELNKRYLDNESKFFYQGKPGEVTLEDYRKDDYGIFPVLDPNMDSQSKRLMQTQALQAIKKDPGVNVYEINKRLLDSMHVTDADKILPPPPTPEEKAKMPPSPQEIMEEEQLENQKLQNDLLAAQRNYYVQKPELEAIRLHLDDKKFEKDLIKTGADVAKDKIDSAIALDEAEALLGEKSMGMALDVTERMSAIQEPKEVEQRIQALEENISMNGQQQTSQPSPAQSPGMIPAAASPEESPSPEEPPTQQPTPQQPEG